MPPSASSKLSAAAAAAAGAAPIAGTPAPHPPAKPATKIIAAVAYASVSMGIMVVNKITMTSFKFPSSSFVGLAQMVFTVLALYVLRAAGCVEFPRLTWDVCRKVNPLPLLFMANLVSGLGGTKAISLPMFTVLRRFSIVMTMAGQYFVLGKPSSCAVQMAVWVMVIGALIAAGNDLAFDLTGYAMILANDFFTAANGIYIQKKAEARELGKFGIIFYNALFSMPFLVMFMMRDPDVFSKAAAFDKWTDPAFVLSFCCSASFGLAITYTIVWCTSVNSALTTTVIGCLKNLVIAYAGMLVGGDYVFSWPNFAGITVSVMGAVIYSIVEFRQKHSAHGAAADPDAADAAGAQQELVTLLVDDEEDGGGGGSGGGDKDTGAYRDDDDDGDEDNFSDEEAAFLAEDGPEEDDAEVGEGGEHNL